MLIARQLLECTEWKIVKRFRLQYLRLSWAWEEEKES